MILPDVNVLVYAHRADTEGHARYRRWLEEALDGPSPVGMSDLVLAGVLRIVSHPKVFATPSPLAEGIAYVDQLRTHPNVRIVSPGERHWALFLDLCRRSGAKGNLVSDAYHAALAIESGCEWITTDRDFARFPGLRWRTPFP
ncbi:MAG: type II toxin-antitoxin system VapC family toxin [Verrucomicrobia bacterium]|nr:type II toxin-antitoxin system VapC family toxin [Verrucomicrobiota bacterium]